MTVVDRAETEKQKRTVFKKKTVHVEWDRGTMSYAQVVGTKDEEGRWDKYAGCTDLVLWVASSETRRQGFVERAAKVKAFMIFTSAGKGMTPFEPVWSTWVPDGSKPEGGRWELRRCPKPVPQSVGVPVAVQGN